jgi:hypothetical protein
VFYVIDYSQPLPNLNHKFAPPTYLIESGLRNLRSQIYHVGAIDVLNKDGRVVGYLKMIYQLKRFCSFESSEIIAISEMEGL